METTKQAPQIEVDVVKPTRDPETGAVPLKEVTGAVRRDSRTDAQTYLDEVKVPFGGE